MAAGMQAFTALELIVPNYPQPGAKKSCKMGLHTRVFHVAEERINNASLRRQPAEGSAPPKEALFTGLKVAI